MPRSRSRSLALRSEIARSVRRRFAGGGIDPSEAVDGRFRLRAGGKPSEPLSCRTGACQRDPDGSREAPAPPAGRSPGRRPCPCLLEAEAGEDGERRSPFHPPGSELAQQLAVMAHHPRCEPPVSARARSEAVVMLWSWRAITRPRSIGGEGRHAAPTGASSGKEWGAERGPTSLQTKAPKVMPAGAARGYHAKRRRASRPAPGSGKRNSSGSGGFRDADERAGRPANGKCRHGERTRDWQRAAASSLIPLPLQSSSIRGHYQWSECRSHACTSARSEMRYRFRDGAMVQEGQWFTAC
jgi:hypothetical protein